MITYCTCGHTVEWHDVDVDTNDGTVTQDCHGNAANLRGPKACPCEAWERRP